MSQNDVTRLYEQTVPVLRSFVGILRFHENLQPGRGGLRHGSDPGWQPLSIFAQARDRPAPTNGPTLTKTSAKGFVMTQISTAPPHPAAPVLQELHTHETRALAHDVRNMVTQLSMVADEMGIHDDPRIRRLAGRIERSIGRVVTMCRTTEGRGPKTEPREALEPCDIMQLLEEVAALVRISAGPHTTINVSGNLRWPVRTLPVTFFRLAMNLTTNAARAVQSVGGGTVFLSARACADGWRFEVMDTGPGLPAPVQAQLTNASAIPQQGRKVSGTQLVRLGAIALGGSLTVPESRTGSTQVVVTLPR